MPSSDLYTQVDTYLTDLFSLSDPVLEAVEQSIRDHGLPEHSVSAAQGQFLALLVRLCQAKRIVEVGTLGGYSSIFLARAMGPEGQLTTIEIDPVAAEVAKENLAKAGLADRCRVLNGPAMELLASLEDNPAPVDLFFMDADKPNYIHYFEWALAHSRKGSLILADNVVREGKVLDQNSHDEKVLGVQAYNAMLAAETRVQSSVLTQIGIKGYDGLAISIVN